jgi:hypothetical protein
MTTMMEITSFLSGRDAREDAKDVLRRAQGIFRVIFEKKNLVRSRQV